MVCGHLADVVVRRKWPLSLSLSLSQKEEREEEGNDHDVTFKAYKIHGRLGTRKEKRK